MNWHESPYIGNGVIACPPAPVQTLSMDTVLEIGFGVITVERDGEVVYRTMDSRRKMRSVEREARRQPESRWTVTFEGPLSGAVFERRGRDEWVLAKRLDGFA